MAGADTATPPCGPDAEAGATLGKEVESIRIELRTDPLAPVITVANVAAVYGEAHASCLASLATMFGVAVRPFAMPDVECIRNLPAVSAAFVDGGATVVHAPVSAIVCFKNENYEYLTREHKTEHPISVAARRMRDAIDGRIAPRDPVLAHRAQSGLYEVIDGNATVQAAMLAGWASVPVCIPPLPI